MALPMWGRSNDEREGGPRPCDMITPLLLLLQSLFQFEVVDELSLEQQLW
ncbi:hypothetical protein LINPERHAP1_LOCUS8261 [Linum perenne]